MKDNHKGLIGTLFDLFNKLFYFTPILLSNRRFRRTVLLPLYSKKAMGKHKKAVQKAVVYMALPETTFSGGLSDRLRGIVAIYSECKRWGLPFRIVFEPLHLEDYLAPNEYDWRIKDEDICWDAHDAYPCVILTYHNSSRNRWQLFVQHTLLRHFLRKAYRQIHVYSNMFCRDEEYAPLFHELFKPTAELQQLIDHHLEQLGGKRNYISLTFRFRQLLGDFKEGGDTLPEAERKPYIERSIATVKRLHGVHPQTKILVTADSHTFLDSLAAEQLPYVYIMPGRVVHIGFTYDASKTTYMKSFLDMYMLSFARTIYQATEDNLFDSTFPKRAALLGGTNYLNFKV